MLLTLKIKLLPKESQEVILLETIKQFNYACNYIAETAFSQQIFTRSTLHKLVYYNSRVMFNLSSQMVVRAIGKVVNSYKSNRLSLHRFKETGSMVYDDRILSFDGLDTVSILTLEGRIKVPMIFSSYHKGMLFGNKIKGQADLIYTDKKFYLYLIIELSEEPIIESDDFLGVDLGIVNIASDSTGERFSGAKINNFRKRHLKLRKKLQSKGTKSAKRLLVKRKRKESRFGKDLNHCISKKIVAKAKALKVGIALENLKGIRQKRTVYKPQRIAQPPWSFYQLKEFILYKSVRARVFVQQVNPAYTSQTCPNCKHIAKENRLTQSNFTCIRCSFVGNADYIAALNIRDQGRANCQLAKRTQEVQAVCF